MTTTEYKKITDPKKLTKGKVYYVNVDESSVFNKQVVDPKPFRTDLELKKYKKDLLDFLDKGWLYEKK